MASSSASFLLAENARARIAHRARERTAPQRAVDVDRSAGDDFGAGGDLPDHGDVAMRKDHRLAGAHRLFQQQRRWLLLRRGFGTRNVVHAGRAAVFEERRQVGPKIGRLGALDTNDADRALGQFGDQVRDRALGLSRTAARSSTIGRPTKKPGELRAHLSSSASQSAIGGCGVSE